MTEDFIAMQQQALRQLEQMQRQAKKNVPPPPPPEPEKPAALPKSPQRFSGLFSLLHMNRDALLILPLILLLAREGADDALLLALLYIML